MLEKEGQNPESLHEKFEKFNPYGEPGNPCLCPKKLTDAEYE
jgi:hypothetical protein